MAARVYRRGGIAGRVGVEKGRVVEGGGGGAPHGHAFTLSFSNQ